MADIVDRRLESRNNWSSWSSQLSSSSSSSSCASVMVSIGVNHGINSVHDAERGIGYCAVGLLIRVCWALVGLTGLLLLGSIVKSLCPLLWLDNGPPMSTFIGVPEKEDIRPLTDLSNSSTEHRRLRPLTLFSNSSWQDRPCEDRRLPNMSPCALPLERSSADRGLYEVRRPLLLVSKSSITGTFLALVSQARERWLP